MRRFSTSNDGIFISEYLIKVEKQLLLKKGVVGRISSLPLKLVCVMNGNSTHILLGTLIGPDIEHYSHKRNADFELRTNNSLHQSSVVIFIIYEGREIAHKRNLKIPNK